MDFEKKYKEALELMKDCEPDGNGLVHVRPCDIFPELAESEDERIRKALIGGLKDCIYSEWHDGVSIEECIAWLEKQGEQKPADKVEPKFHEGEWIIHHGTENIYQVVAIIDNQYQLKYGDNYTVQNCADVDRCTRLWDITKDAKDGDVLCTYECDEPKIVFILKGTPKKHYALDYHCYYNIMYPHFPSDSEKGCLAPNDEDVKPATKEQRELLFQKMKEAGYEWDVYKLELKKIEQKPTEWHEKIKGLDKLETYVLSIAPDRPLDAVKVDSKNIRFLINKEQKPAWSEEDERYLSYAIYAVEDILGSNGENTVTWLKSLKERVQPQPKKEWSEEDKNMLQSILDEYKSMPTEKRNWLKSLKDRYTWEPSDKQIMALRWVLNHIPYDSHKEEISGLLEQLKKLR